MRILGTLIAGIVLLLPARARGQEHVVSPAELAGQLRAAAQSRRDNIATIDRFLETDTARQALHSMRADPVKVRQAVSQLGDGELAKLAQQAAGTQADFAGGALSHFQITLIIVGAIVLAVIIAIAAAT